MKVQDLIKILKKADPKADIVLSSDAEGNNFGLLSDCGIGFYSKEGCEIILQYDEEKDKNSKKCIVLWPE